MNLIICHTPLQVLVAEKIMQKYPNEEFYGIMFMFESYNNLKIKTYWERFKEKCIKSFLFNYPQSGRVDLFKALFKAKQKVKNLQVDKIFIGSIDNQFVQLMCSAVKFNQLYTFDDGTINIVPNSAYYQPQINTLKRRLSNCLLGNRYDTQQLRRLSSKHFSIFPNMPNIINNVEYIHFANFSQNSTACNQEPIKLLLGQPLFLNNEENIRLASRVIEQFGIDVYLPHPRESYRLDSVEYIETNLIFEDYISQAATTQKYIVYTYFSGAVLNVKNHPNIEVISLKPPLTDPVYLACYDLFEQMNIPIIDI